MQGWKLGLKAIAIYRDGCKRPSRSTRRPRDRRRRQGRKGVPAAAAPPAAPAAARAAPPEAPGRAPRDHAQVLGRRAEGTSRSASTRTGRRARSSSRWPRRARRSRPHGAFATAISLTLQYGFRSRRWSRSSATCASSPRATRRTRDPDAKSLVGLHLPLARLEVPDGRPEERAGSSPAKAGTRASGRRSGSRGGSRAGPRRKGARDHRALNAITKDAKAEPVEAARSASPFGAGPTPGGDLPEQRRRPELPRVRQPHVRSAACYKCMNCGATRAAAEIILGVFSIPQAPTRERPGGFSIPMNQGNRWPGSPIPLAPESRNDRSASQEREGVPLAAAGHQAIGDQRRQRLLRTVGGEGAPRRYRRRARAWRRPGDAPRNPPSVGVRSTRTTPGESR